MTVAKPEVEPAETEVEHGKQLMVVAKPEVEPAQTEVEHEGAVMGSLARSVEDLNIGAALIKGEY